MRWSRAAEGGDDGAVDAAGADDGVPGRVERGEGGADGDGLPALTSPVMTPRPCSVTHRSLRHFARI